jgi:hypothetical protein
MLIDFFYTLRSAKLPVSVKEYLTLVEALKEGVVGPQSDGAYSIDDFYYLARTALVKDEKHYDKFDRAFAAYFKGVELLADFSKDVPAGVAAQEPGAGALARGEGEDREDGLGRAHGDAQEAFEEQKERHEGGSKMIGTGGTSPFGAYGFNPQGIRIGQDKSRNKSAVKVWDQRAYKDYDDSQELGTRNIKIALRRLRKFAREGRRGRTGPGRHHPLHRRQRRLAWTSRWCPRAQQREGAAADGRGRHHGRTHPPRRGDVLGRQGGVQAPGVLLLPQLRLRLHVEEQPAALQREVPDLGHHPQVQQGLQAGFVGDATMSPYEILQPGGSVEYNNEEAGAEWLQRLTQRLPQVRLDQPRAAGRVAVPPEHQRDPAADEPAHVPADDQGPGRGDAAAEQIGAAPPTRTAPEGPLLLALRRGVSS